MRWHDRRKGSFWFSFSTDLEVRRVIAPKALDRFKGRVREITQRAKGVSIETTIEELASYMRGWGGYFGFCETPAQLAALINSLGPAATQGGFVAAVENAASSPGRITGTGSAIGEQYRRQRSRPLVSREGQGPVSWAFQWVLQIARTSIVRGLLA